MKFSHLIFIFTALLFPSCSPSSAIDFHHEGEAQCRALIKELEQIENREQLLRSEPQLKKRFESLVDLMIAAREFQHSHLGDPDLLFEETATEERLQEELRRIYAIEGGREVIERFQQEALVRLDGYERSVIKRKNKLKVSKN